MRRKVFLFLLCSLLFAPAGCKKPSATQEQEPSPPPASSPGVANQESRKFDACDLIKKEEIEAIQGSPIIDTKGSGRSGAGVRVSQCFYTAAEFHKSVSLAVTQNDPDNPGKRSTKDFWKETFGGYSSEGKEQKGDKEKKESLREQQRGQREEEKVVPPKKIDGIGDEAYWTGNRADAALYVLKKDAFIRISVGGTDNEETKLEKSKVLAQKAIDRL